MRTPLWYWSCTAKHWGQKCREPRKDNKIILRSSGFFQKCLSNPQCLLNAFMEIADSPRTLLGPQIGSVYSPLATCDIKDLHLNIDLTSSSSSIQMMSSPILPINRDRKPSTSQQQYRQTSAKDFYENKERTPFPHTPNSQRNYVQNNHCRLL